MKSSTARKWTKSARSAEKKKEILPTIKCWLGGGEEEVVVRGQLVAQDSHFPPPLVADWLRRLPARWPHPNSICREELGCMTDSPHRKETEGEKEMVLTEANIINPQRQRGPKS